MKNVTSLTLIVNVGNMNLGCNVWRPPAHHAEYACLPDDQNEARPIVERNTLSAHFVALSSVANEPTTKDLTKSTRTGEEFERMSGTYSVLPLNVRVSGAKVPRA